MVQDGWARREEAGPVQDCWALHLPMAEFAVNSAHHESVRNMPFFLHGRYPVTTATRGWPAARVPAATDFAAQLEAAVQRGLMRNAQQRQKEYTGARRRERSFQEGEEVLLSTRNITVLPGAQKLMPLFWGRPRIREQMGELAYRLNVPASLQKAQFYRCPCRGHTPLSRAGARAHPCRSCLTRARTGMPWRRCWSTG
jgi:hypothetical protein